MKSTIDTAIHFLPTGTPGSVAQSWNRAALAAQVAAAALRLGLGPDLTREQMTGLAQVIRDGGRRPLSAETEQAIRAALQEPLTAEHDPREIAEALFSRLPDAPLPVVGADGSRYMVVAVPVG
ncbi:hypothetical protein [Peterkaempfera griseoplana]|uniref:hypothetical protein n=1 Tax=Peterkaempfera griseoplana TaxID=66896 RepID=UPI0006E2839D|nr:hypothetical protein [Peterkaempfera griseoplana]